MRGMKKVQELIREESIRLSVSEKGGDFVLILRQLAISLTNNYLEDALLYQPSSVKEFKRQNRKLNNEWVHTAEAAVSFCRKVQSNLTASPYIMKCSKGDCSNDCWVLVGTPSCVTRLRVAEPYVE
ncbi:hypothetical protein KIN20_005648 [Parelaphostrongylus tenuis]|uniref:Uncharacterized protein n=1 Tax=Parelaphostrongylus tenuis TaxID=148309 RepID=A0AAD5QFB7_PARTN|nr:hypothetical protein KIN20_005648 [Parelaphostrongylus tenuis]